MRSNPLQRNTCTFLQCSTPVLKALVASKCRTNQYPRSALSPLAGGCREYMLIDRIPRVLTAQSSLQVPLRTWMTLRFESRTIPKTFMWVRRLALTTLSEEQALLDIEWSKEASGRQKVTRSRLIHVFDADPDSQSTSWMTSPLERARFWNLSALRSIRERFPAPHLPYRSRTPFNRGVTFTPSRKRSVVPSNSTCFTKAQVRTINSTV